MKIAYVTTYDASDVRHWSGTGYYMAKSLKDQSIAIDYIGPLKDQFISYYFKAKQVLFRKVLNKGYQFYREPYVLKYYAEQISEKLKGSDADVVLCPGTTPISYLECNKPLVIWTDSAFGGLIDFYSGHSNLTQKTIRDGRRAEQLALTKCSLAFYSSDWAAKVSIANYQVDSSKVKVIPYGANIDCNRKLADVKELINSRSPSECKLLFLGVDWYRKGGDVAFSVAKELNRQGIVTRLTVVGCKPKLTEPQPEWLRAPGFISKSSNEGRELLDKLIAESHFLIVPSRAEAYGVVFCEANSFGVPCLATSVGGIPTIIHDDINGMVFPLNAGTQEYCDYISNIMSNQDRYLQLALDSFNEYESRLNWDTAGRTAMKYLLELKTHCVK
jgi:glycosyltransferase involved in cell wall biosynthesis